MLASCVAVLSLDHFRVLVFRCFSSAFGPRIRLLSRRAQLLLLRPLAELLLLLLLLLVKLKQFLLAGELEAL